jgi:DNA polymerase V
LYFCTKGFFNQNPSEKGKIQDKIMQSSQLHFSSTLEIYSALTETELSLPFAENGISAGFPSPALDFVDLTIDLNRHLIKHPSSTFYGLVKGHSMRNVGINDKDLLVIDKSLEPTDNKIAVCYIDGEYTLKRIKIEKKQCWLMPENENYQPIKVNEENDFLIWGIVTYVIKSF